MSKFVTIFNGALRLYDSGLVKHYDADIGLWRNGWGPWATVAVLGRNETVFDNWRERVQQTREDKP